MIAQRLCERVVESGLLARVELSVFGEEPEPAYDRVHLSQVLRDGNAERLALRPLDWFAQQGVTRKTGRVVAIDREQRAILLDNGKRFTYENLVLATGSGAIRPALPGATDPRVFVYRTLNDALKLRSLVLALPESQRSVSVVGAGLLGLEVAEVLCDLGCQVQLAEAADHLLPRQLDAQSSQLFQQSIEGRGFTFRLGTKLKTISSQGNDQPLRLSWSDDSNSEAMLVVFAVGVRPRDELARAAGLTCDLFGGVMVNEALQTSDPHIFALGECARFQGQSFGLVAPGYAMVDVLVDRLLGQPRAFSGWQPNLRLKLRDTHVAAFGESNAAGTHITTLVRQREGELTRLVLQGYRITGITALGVPTDLSALQQAFARGDRLSPRALRRFERGLPLFQAEPIDLQSWPMESTVCSCIGVTRGTLEDARQAGADSLERLMRRTSAGTVCGTCRPLLASLVGDVAPKENRMLPLSVAAMATTGILLLVLLPALPWPENASHATWLERLGANSSSFAWKQWSGFTLLAVLSLAGAYGLRHKIASQQRRRAFRTLHLALGLLSLVGFAAHTGFRLGYGIDRWLGVSMLLVIAAGTLAALALGAPPSTINAGRRRRTTRWHLWLSWPLPALVLIHVFKAYWF